MKTDPLPVWLRRAATCLALAGSLSAAQAATIEPVDSVNPLSGTNGTDGFSRGNAYPAICQPFSATTWSPTTNNSSSWFYTMDGKQFEGMRSTHQPSVWIRDYAEFTYMPVVGKIEGLTTRDQASPFSHEREKALPYYYSVELDRYKTKLEVAPADRSCLAKISFPDSGERSLVFRNPRGEFNLTVDPERRRITGTAKHVTFGAPGNFAMYFVAEFDHPFTSAESLPSAPKEKDAVACALHFGDGPMNKTVQMRLGTSFISYEQAALNLKRELPDWSLDATKNRARTAWAKELATIDIEGGTDAQRSTFYTALYRLLQFPRAFHEYDATGKMIHYSPFNDGKALKDGPLYTDNGLWDTYRAAFPAFTVFFPEHSSSIIQGWLNAYREGGWLPTWPSPGNRGCMIGSHGQSIITDAYLKGIKGLDKDVAYEAVRKDSTVPAGGAVGRDNLDNYIKYNFVPNDKRHDGGTAVTLEYAYDDYCAAKFARAMGKEDDAKTFFERARNYRNVWHAEDGFMRGRKADGTWSEPFDPIEWGGPYVEGNAWQWTWSVMQDPYGLMALMGGKDGMAKKLDTMLSMGTDYKPGTYGGTIHEMRETVAAKMGQYAHVNEPCHHVLYFYDYAGQPWKTQYNVRRVMDELYGPDGMFGDEDTGQMSAWYVFNAAGFYSFCPGNPIYLMGSPLFEKFTLHLPGGKTFTVRAKNNNPANRYIQAAKFNGQPTTKTWLAHDAIMQGGTLDLDMGPQPNEKWGSGPNDAPVDEFASMK